MRGCWSRPELLDELVEQTLDHPTPKALLRYQILAMSAWGHAERLGSVDVPTIVVHGAEDQLSPTVNGEEIARRIPGASLRKLEGVGHLVPLEAPHVLSEAIAQVSRRSSHRPRGRCAPGAS